MFSDRCKVSELPILDPPNMLSCPPWILIHLNLWTENNGFWCFCPYISSGKKIVLESRRTPTGKCVGKRNLVAEMRWKPYEEKYLPRKWCLVLLLSQANLWVGWIGHTPVPWRCRANSQILLLQLVWRRLLLPTHISNPTCASGSSLGPISSLKPYR